MLVGDLVNKGPEPLQVAPAPCAIRNAVLILEI